MIRTYNLPFGVRPEVGLLTIPGVEFLPPELDGLVRAVRIALDLDQFPNLSIGIQFDAWAPDENRTKGRLILMNRKGPHIDLEWTTDGRLTVRSIRDLVRHGWMKVEDELPVRGEVVKHAEVEL